MIYNAHRIARRSTPLVTRPLATGLRLARHERNPLADGRLGRGLSGLLEIAHRAFQEYPKQSFDVVDETSSRPRFLDETVIARRPFADLVRFEVPDAGSRSKVLIAAALSGHHATLLRDTVRGFARDFVPYITDWTNARDVPLEDGGFGVDEYVQYLIDFLETLGPRTHLVATCQAAPLALVAAAVLASRRPELVPASLTLMAGPVDTTVNKSLINRVTDVVPLGLLRAATITRVPRGFAGAGRRVYPGFIQLSGFMLLNLVPHLRSHLSFVKNAARGGDDAGETFRAFYDEYYSVLDMTEQFYIETLRRVFFEHHIPKGMMTFKGEPVDFSAIERMPLLTVEGANDNMCPVGQTRAAHDICQAIPNELRAHHIQEGVGHYGIFSGSRFRNEIYPVTRDFIRAAEHKAG